mgnify:CR=1 FL=1
MGIRQFSNINSPVSLALIPSLFSFLPIEKPGVRFEYQSGDSQLLGYIVEKATGKDLSAYAQEKLWNNFTDQNDYKCDNCMTKIISRKKIETYKWPNNLIIVLRRFDSMMRKNNEMIECKNIEAGRLYLIETSTVHDARCINTELYQFFISLNI